MVLSEEEIKQLGVIASLAAEEGSRVLSKWLRTELVIKSDHCEIASFQKVAEGMDRLGHSAIATYMAVEQGFEGSMVLFYEESAAYRLVDILMKKPQGTTQTLGEIERSALLETANIIGSAYLNIFGKNLGTKLSPSVPVLLHDSPHAIIDSILMEQAAEQDEALLTEILFEQNNLQLTWEFLFLPRFLSLKEILSKMTA